MEEREIRKRLFALQRHNSHCADCEKPGVHRSFGTHITAVKSVTQDVWTQEMVSAFEQLGGNGKVNSVLEKHLDAYIENAASPSPSSSSLSSPSSPLSSLTFSGKPSVRSDYSSRGAYIRAKYDGVFATPLHMNEMQERQKAVNSRRLEHQRTQRLVDRFLVVGRGPLIKIPPRTKREHDTSSVAVLSPVHNSGAGVSPGNHADHDRGTTHEDLTVTVDDLLGAEFEPTLLDGYPLSSHFVSTLYKQKDKIKDEIVTCRGDSDGRYTSDYTDDDEDRDKYEQGDEDRDSDKKRKVKEEEDMHSENPPPNLSMFLFPENVKLESTCKDPTCFTFVFTKVNGLRQYGVCLRFYECLDQTSVDCLRKEGREWKEEKCSNKDHDKTDSADNEINSQVSLSPSLPSSSSPPFSSTPASSSSPQCCPVVYQPVSIALVSQYPMYSVMECFLKLLYRISLSSPPIPLERFISNFMNEVPLPPRGIRSIQYSIADDQIMHIQRAPPNELENHHHHMQFRMLFRVLRLHNIVCLVTAMATEKRIILTSSRWSLLTGVSEAARALLFPLKLQSVYMPILPARLIDFLYAPVPFVAGVHSSILMRVPRFEDLEDAIIVDLDHEIFCVAKEYPRALSDHRRERERIKWEQLEKRRRARGFQGYRNCKLGISLSPSLLEKDRMRASLTTLNNIIGNNNNSYDLRSNENSNDIGTQSANGLGKTNDATHGKKSIIDSISTHVYSCVEYRSYCNRLGLSPLPDRDYNKLIASLDAQGKARNMFDNESQLIKFADLAFPKGEHLSPVTSFSGQTGVITNEFCGGRKNSKTASVQAPYPKAYASCSFEKFPAQPQASLVHTSASSSLRGTSSLFSSSALQSSLQSSSLSSSSSSTLSAKRETIDVNQVRECFLRVWVKLLLNYRDFLTPCPSSSSSSLSPSANKTKVKGEDRVKKRKNDNSNSNNDIGNRTLGGDGRPAELFRSEAYLAHFSGTSNKSNQIRTFMRDILETQSFSVFIDERWSFNGKPSPSDAAEVKFFDECILAKLNRSRLTVNQPTPFLNDKSYRVTETFTVPPPNSSELYEHQYDRSVWPVPLSRGLFGPQRRARYVNETARQRRKTRVQAYRRYAQTQGSGGGQTASRRGSRGGVRQRKRSQSKRKDTLSTSARSNEDMNMLNGKENRDISNASRSSEEEASSSPLSVANKYKDVHDGKPHQQYNQDQDDTVQSIVNSIHHQHYVQEQARRFRGTRKAIKSLQAHIRTQQAQASSMKKLGVIKQLQRLSRTILRRKMHQRLCKATAILQAKLRARVTVEWANDYIKATQVLQAHVRRENARKTCASMLFVVDKLQQCAKVRAVRKGYLAKLSAIAVLQAYAHGKFARRAFEVWLNRQNHRLKLDILHMWNAHQTSYLYRSFYWMQCVGDSINDRFCADGSTGSQGSGKGDRTDSKRESKSTHVKSSPLPSSSSSASLLSPSCKTLSLHRQELRRLLKLSPSSPSSRGAFRLDSDLFSEKHLFFAHLRQIPDTLKALVYRECGVNHRGKRRKERLWQALWNGRLCSGGSSWSSGHGLTGRVHEKNMDIERDYDDAYTSYHTTLGDDDDLSKLGCGGGRTSGGAQRKAMAMEMKEAKILQLQRHRDSIINDVEASSCYADVIRDGDYYSSISSTSHFTSSNLMRDAELSTKVLLTLSLAQRLNEEKRISSSNAVTQGVDFAVLYSHLLRFMNKLDDRDFNYYTRKTQILHEKGWLHKYQRWLPSSPSSLSLVLSPRFDGSGRSKYQCHQQQQYQTLVLLGIMMSINKVKLTYH